MEEETLEETPMEEESDTGDADPAAQTFGPACGEVPADGGLVHRDGHRAGRHAASDNPLLKTLVAAVTEADLVDTLNSADGHHRLRADQPGLREDAFSKSLNGLLTDKETLTQS